MYEHKVSRISKIKSRADEDDDEDEDPESEPEAAPEPEPTPVPKKKKNKGKKKKKAAAAAAEEGGGDDEIDRALRQLELEPTKRVEKAGDEGGVLEVPLAQVLKVDSRNLDAASEMRKMFGRDAMRGEDEAPRGGGRGRGGPGGGRGGRGLVAGRRNTFVQPKEEWPNSGSGGLGMEVVLDGDIKEPGVTEFAFVHSRAYQDVQRQFMMCVASMGLFTSPPA